MKNSRIDLAIIKVGATVFDLPSRSPVTILEISGTDNEIFLTDAKPDPTGDGAFPDGWRNDWEVCAVDDPDREAKAEAFIY